MFEKLHDEANYSLKCQFASFECVTESWGNNKSSCSLHQRKSLSNHSSELKRKKNEAGLRGWRMTDKMKAAEPVFSPAASYTLPAKDAPE